MNTAGRFLSKAILLLVILVVGLALHFITEWMKKKRAPEWKEFEEKVEQFNEKHGGDVSDEAKEFLETHINDSQTSHAKYIIKHDENYRNSLDKEE